MRLLLDQDVYAVTARFLANLGHDIVPAHQAGLSQASDDDLIRAAHEQDRLLVTRDRDFGALVFVRKLHGGILYLRMLSSTVDAVHRELQRVLTAYSEEELRVAFVVVEPAKHRFRKILH